MNFLDTVPPAHSAARPSSSTLVAAVDLPGICRHCDESRWPGSSLSLATIALAVGRSRNARSQSIGSSASAAAGRGWACSGVDRLARRQSAIRGNRTPACSSSRSLAVLRQVWPRHDWHARRCASVDRGLWAVGAIFDDWLGQFAQIVRVSHAAGPRHRLRGSCARARHSFFRRGSLPGIRSASWP